MRFLELQLRRFGHFDERSFPFEPSAGLVVLHGPNEAGKTTLLQAIRGLLYGIPNATPYGFRSGYDGMEIGARLEEAGGAILEIRRHKRRKDPLTGLRRSGAGAAPFDDAALRSILGTVDAETFQSVFGFTLEDLQRGAEGLKAARFDEILAGGSLGGGGGRIREVQARLEEEAQELYRPNGQKYRINETLRRLKDRKDELGQKSLGGQAYRSLVEELQRSRDASAALARRVGALEPERARAQRLVDALEDFWAHRDLGRRLSGPELVTPLDSDAAAGVQALLGEAGALRRSIAAAEDELRRLEEKVAAVPVDADVLERSATIDALFRRLHQIEELREAREANDAALRREAGALAEGAAELLDGGPDALLGWKVERAQHEALARLVPQWREKHGAHRAAEDLLRSAERTAEDARRTLEALPAADEEEAIGILAAEAAQIRQQRAEALRLSREVAEGEAECSRGLARLRPTLAELGDVRLPPKDAVLEARADQERLRGAVEKLQGQEAEKRVVLAADAALRDELIRAGDVPTPEQLRGARELRDATWAGMREAWQAGRTVDMPVASAFEGQVREADRLADRMREASERLAQVLQLGGRIRQTEAELEQLGLQRARAEALYADWELRWRGLWAESGIEPLAPGAMAAWLDEVQRLLQRHDRLLEQRRQLELAEGAVAGFEERVRTLVASQGEMDVVALVEVRERRDREARIRRDAAVQQLEKAEAALERARADRDRLHGELSKLEAALAALWPSLGLPAGLDPDAGQRRIADLEALSGRARRLVEDRAAATAAAARVEGFDAEVAALAAGLHVEAEGRGPAALVEWLHRRLEAQRKAAATRQERVELVEQGAERLAQERSRLAALERELASWLERCGAAGEEELRILAQRALDRAGLAAKHRELDLRLERTLGADRGAAEELLAGTTEAELRHRLAELERELKEARARELDAAGALAVLEKQFAGLGGDEGARLQAEYEADRAELQRLVERYARVQLARELLQRVVDRFVRENQPALLQRTSELVRQLTGGRYVRVVRPLGSDGLVLEAEDGRTKEPSALSSGTREQLFLALRLAYVQEHGRQAEPLPIVIDDALVNFDPGRTRTALGALAEIGRRNQVLFLTCHDHVVDLARQASPDVQVVSVV